MSLECVASGGSNHNSEIWARESAFILPNPLHMDRPSGGMQLWTSGTLLELQSSQILQQRT